MKRGLGVLLTTVCLLGANTVLAASFVTYSVTVDTSTLDGQTGFVEFQFNPGTDLTPAASVDIRNFTNASALSGLAQTIGGAVGTLGGNNVTLNNTGGWNDYYQGYTFGSQLTFTQRFSVPDPATGDVTSGSVFAFNLWREILEGDTVTYVNLLAADPDAPLFTVTVDEGTTKVDVGNAKGYVSVAAAPVPLPPAVLLFASGLACMGLFSRRKLD